MRLPEQRPEMKEELVNMAQVTTRKGVVIQDPSITRLLFSDTRFAWLWLIVRLYLGWTWLDAGLHKLTDPAWMVTGEALKGFWQRAVQIPQPPARPLIAFDWYRAFIQALLDGSHYGWFAKLVTLGEVAVGIALIVGAFVGIAAFFGAFMNWNYIMAGTASANGLMIVLAILLVLAWKVAGWYGLDRILLPYLGTLWNRSDTIPAQLQPQPAKT
jgi:thiosulfate dehydrogenase [quinone] large subunit